MSSVLINFSFAQTALVEIVCVDKDTTENQSEDFTTKVPIKEAFTIYNYILRTKSTSKFILGLQLVTNKRLTVVPEITTIGVLGVFQYFCRGPNRY